MVHIVGCLEADVVLDELGVVDVGVRRVQIREHLAGGDVGIAHVAGLDSAEEDVVNIADEELFECLVGVVVFLEYLLGLILCSEDGGGLRGRCGGGNFRVGTRFGRRNEESGQ